jgi:hypothetical protein
LIVGKLEAAMWLVTDYTQKKKYNRKKVPKIKISTLTPSITSEPRLSANYLFKLY